MCHIINLNFPFSSQGSYVEKSFDGNFWKKIGKNTPTRSLGFKKMHVTSFFIEAVAMERVCEIGMFEMLFLRLLIRYRIEDCFHGYSAIIFCVKSMNTVK